MTGALFWFAGAIWLSGPRATGQGPAEGSDAPHPAARTGRRLAPPVAATGGVAVICVALLGATTGVVLATMVAPIIVIALRRRQDRDQRQLADHELARLPLVIDLAAELLTCGQPLPSALDVAAGCAGAQLEARLRQVAGLLRLGAEPALAWQPFAAEPALRPIAVASARSADSGIALAATFTQLATELRAQARARAQRRAERVGVWAIAPLGLCFLPAFVCLGIAPVIIGVAQPLLTSIRP